MKLPRVHAVEEARGEFVRRLMPHNEERGLIICLVCGGDGIGGGSVVHFTACTLALMMKEWGWDTITHDDPPWRSTCIHKMCTAESGTDTCGHPAMVAG